MPPAFAALMGDMAPVIALVDRFGDELEYDLHAHLGLDLLDFFRGHYTWAKLARLAANLPWHSRYKLATDNDEEIAAAVLDADTEQESSRPSLLAWDEGQDLKAAIVDGFNRLAAIESGQKKAPSPVPRPETARDRVQRQREADMINDIMNIFAPGR